MNYWATWRSGAVFSIFAIGVLAAAVAIPLVPAWVLLERLDGFRGTLSTVAIILVTPYLVGRGVHTMRKYGL